MRSGVVGGIYGRGVGDYAQTLVDVDATDEDAPRLKQRVLSWLINDQIVAAELSDCVLGAEEGGYAPGENYSYAIVGRGSVPVTATRLWTNGLSIDATRSVYWASDLDSVTCPRCGHREPLELAGDGDGRFVTAFRPAMLTWVDGGSGEVACASCGEDVGLNDWEWSHPWAFGTLGVKMWNWDPIGEEFITDLSELLDGHRLVYSCYKL